MIFLFASNMPQARIWCVENGISNGISVDDRGLRIFVPGNGFRARGYRLVPGEDRVVILNRIVPISPEYAEMMEALTKIESSSPGWDRDTMREYYQT